MIPLPAIFLDAPIAHRAYHDRNSGRPENSRGAIFAAVEAGYNIEIDVQLSSDAVAMVFHDYELRRLTHSAGRIGALSAKDLSEVRLRDCNEGIPTLREVLNIIAGRVGILIEIKDQDGAMGTNVGPLEADVADALQGYAGPVAVMSFNPNSIAAFRKLSPETPVGLTTSAYSPEGWPLLPAATRDYLREIPDVDRVGASFISHEAADLRRPRVTDLKSNGVAVLCWTIRSTLAEAEARRIAQNVTFESYPAALRA
jgi:glycerophosphoryl diester phosphodiesterase